MAKSKKKKQKTADFQKVKLKVGKSKPVGTNVTDTAFKASTITIGAQFKVGDEPVNRKNLSLRELLSQLNHYNVNVRHEALGGLLDLFKTHPSVMHDNLNVWLSKVFIKLTDTDADVRHSLYVCLNYAFTNLLEVEVSPFFKVIMTHICCGLTHINEGIQLDCLDILGIVLDKCPTLFIPFSMKILENVIDLISTQTSKEASSPTMRGGKIKRGIPALVSYHLSADAESRLSTIKTRTRILEKLYQIIKIFRQPKDALEGEESKDDNVVNIKKGGQVFVPLYKYSIHPMQVQHMELETLLDIGKKYKIRSDTEKLNSMMLKIFPIILNIWVEYEPHKLSANFNDSYFSQSILPGMKVIIDVLDILLDPLQECGKDFHNNLSVLFKSHAVDVMSHFLTYFVLPIHFPKTTSIKSNPGLAQRFSIDFNFVMAKIICSLLKQSGSSFIVLESKQRITFFKRLTCFISLMIDSNSFIVDKKKITELLSVVDTLLEIKQTCERKEAEVVDTALIFKELLAVYKVASLSSAWKIPVLQFFSKYIVDRDFAYLLRDNSLSEYTDGFTQSLIANIWSIPASSDNLIKESFAFMKLILVRNFVNDNIMSSLSETLVEMTKPCGLFTNVKDTLQRCITEIVFYVDIPDALLKNLAALCHLDSISLEIKKYLISVIGYCTHRKERSLEFEKYLSFILSVAIGFTMDGLLKFNVERANSVSWSILNIFRNESKQIPINYIIEQLEQLDGLNHVVPMLVSVTGQFLIQLRKLPLTVAFSLVKLLHHFSSTSYNFNSFQSADMEINQVADLLSAIFLYIFSDTYQRVTNANATSRNDEQLTMEDNLKSSSIKLLLCNNLLLRQLIKKWINIMGEYKMNAVCVNSIVEVLIKMLQEPTLMPVLREFKGNLQSIVNAFYPICIPQIEKFLIEQLQMQVMLL